MKINVLDEIIWGLFIYADQIKLQLTLTFILFPRGPLSPHTSSGEYIKIVFDYF